MKKIFVIISAVLILVSCKKAKVEVEEIDFERALNSEIIAVIDQTDLTVMKQSYSMLSNENQELLWKTKLVYLVNNDKSLTANQKSLVGKLYKLLIENGIAKLKANNAIADEFIAKYEGELQNNFKAEQLYFLIEHPLFKKKFSLVDSKMYLNTISSNKNINNIVTGECACRYNIGCGFGNSCAVGGCSGGTDCGLFGSSSCKGLCKQENGGPVL